jgi:hypothetical protein
MANLRLSTMEFVKTTARAITIIDDYNIRITSNNGVEYIRRYYSLADGTIQFNFRSNFYNIKNGMYEIPREDNKVTAEPSSVTVVIESPTGEKVVTEASADAVTDGKIRHAKYNQIKTCIENDIPVYLVGDAGTGKNFTLQEIAEDLGLTFYFTNSVQQEYKITGFIDAGGVYHETEFYKAFKNGGLFFLDEIDASIPEVLVLLNAAIANRYFEFPNGRINAHPDFRVVAAGNTVGSGANELYTGRLVLDQATLDRFVVIKFDYDRNIELVLAKGNEKLVNFIRGLRRYAKENGIRATFSYRCIITVTKLEAVGLPLPEILEIAVFKGMDADTIKTFKTDFVKDGNTGRYYYGLQEYQKAC